MGKIALLDTETIDRIAAGEVVERPSSVVKELTENAIDAEASSVTVEIRKGGKELIRVTDNGSGIAGEMVPLAFERHSTSKLRRIEDLETIATLGFRGEALSSIAAVSRVEMMTRTAEEITGTLCRIEGGITKEMREAGLPQGTTILVRDLFYGVPARQKFLKTDQTETAYVTELVEQLALSHPQIAFRLITDGKTKLQTAGSGRLRDVIYRLYGGRIVKNLIPFEKVNAHYKISGFLGAPALSRGNRRYESCFVNGRYVKDRILQKGIEDGYKRYLMQHQFPFAVVFFTADGNLLDVNVHPSKAQVRFSAEKDVYDFVCSSVSEALHEPELIEVLPLGQTNQPDTAERRILSRGSFAADMVQAVPVRDTSEPYEVHRSAVRPLTAQADPHAAADTQAASAAAGSGPEDSGTDLLHQTTLRSVFQTQKSDVLQNDTSSALPETYEQLSIPMPQTARARFRLIGSVFDTYWLLEFDGKLYLVDQHAAHERVNYEKFLHLFREEQVASQQVFPAVVVTLQAQEADLIEQYAGLIQAYGFEIEHFGGNEYRVAAVPAQMFGMNAEGFLLSFLDEISDLSAGRAEPDTITDRLAAAACKASVKGHDVITNAEALQLLEILFACEDPYHCPHGRPTLVSMTKQEIEKMFRRIVS